MRREKIDIKTTILHKKEYDFKYKYPYYFTNKYYRDFVFRHKLEGKELNERFKLFKGHYCLTFFKDKRNKKGYRIELKELFSLDDIDWFTSSVLIKRDPEAKVKKDG